MGNRARLSLTFILCLLVPAGCSDDSGVPSADIGTHSGTDTGSTDSNTGFDVGSSTDSGSGVSTDGGDDTHLDTDQATESAPDSASASGSDTGGGSDTSKDGTGDTNQTDTTKDCVDEDSDGWCAEFDCDDNNENANPDQEEIPGNQVDDDCDGSTDEMTCVPVSDDETVCDGLDDDCNGWIDDVDVGGDGICDCLRIGVMGTPGVNPSANFKAWLEERGTSVTRFHNKNAPELTPADLLPFDVVIVDRLVRLYSSNEAAILKNWVTGGGGVMFMTGYTAGEPSWARPNSLMEPLGLEYEGGPLKNGPITDFASHPITKGLTSVTFLGGWAVLETNADPAAKNTVVAHLPAKGGAAGTAQERGKGRVFAWGDEWIEFDSEWTKLPEIEQLWVNILGWLGPQDSCQINVQ